MSHNVIFFGTPAIAASCLQALLDEGINVVGVVTKPDKEVGRKHEIKESEVKVLAKKYKLHIFQPNKVSEIQQDLKKLNPHLIVVCAYGKILGESILNLPIYHCVNVHTSLLPRWRGGAPIHHAVLHRDIKSGISLMYMSKELDSGDIIYQEAFELSPYETYRSLYIRLSHLIYEVVRKKINSLFNHNIKTIKQNPNEVTIAKNISREDELIDWNKSSLEVDAKIRGLFDEPIAYTSYDNKIIKIYEANVLNDTHIGNPAEIISIDRSGISVVCNKGVIRITKLQISGKNPILVKDMLNGNHPFRINTKFN